MSATATAADYDPAEVIADVRRWVWARARGYAEAKGRPDLAADLAGEVFGRIGVLLSEKYEGTGRYDPARGAATTWAARVAWSVLPDAFGRLAGPYALRGHGRRLHRAARRRAAALGLDPDEAVGPPLRLGLSLDEPMPLSGERWDFPDPASVAPASGASADERAEAVRAAVARLRAREREAVTLYFGLGDAPALTLAEVGEALGGVTKERARQIVGAALRQVERELAPMFGPAGGERGEGGEA